MVVGVTLGTKWDPRGGFLEDDILMAERSRQEPAGISGMGGLRRWVPLKQNRGWRLEGGRPPEARR